VSIVATSVPSTLIFTAPRLGPSVVMNPIERPVKVYFAELRATSARRTEP
jgi:hypothetical protein